MDSKNLASAEEPDLYFASTEALREGGLKLFLKWYLSHSQI